MVFRWVLENILAPLRENRKLIGMGVAVGSGRLLYVAWADDTWLIAHGPE